MSQGQHLTGNFFVSLLQLSRRLEHLHKSKGIQIMSLPYAFGYSCIPGTCFEPQTIEQQQPSEEKVENIPFTFMVFPFIHLGPVVQGIVSLTISLRHKFVKQISAKVTNTLLFFVEKM